MKADIEFREMLGRLSDTETQALRESIEAEGVREPLTLWSRWICPDCGEVAAPSYHAEVGDWDCGNCGHTLTDGEYDAAVDASVLVDGYNRYGIASALDIDVPLRFVLFDDRADAKSWIARNQLGRRNIGPEKAAYCRGILYNESKQPVGRPEKCGQNVHNIGRTAETIAEQFGVTEKTVRRDGEFAEAVDVLDEIIPGTREKALSGEIPKSRVMDAGKAAKAGDAAGARVALTKEQINERAKEAGRKAEESLRAASEAMRQKKAAELALQPVNMRAAGLMEAAGGLTDAIPAVLKPVLAAVCLALLVDLALDRVAPCPHLRRHETLRPAGSVLVIAAARRKRDDEIHALFSFAVTCLAQQARKYFCFPISRPRSLMDAPSGMRALSRSSSTISPTILMARNVLSCAPSSPPSMTLASMCGFCPMTMTGSWLTTAPSM